VPGVAAVTAGPGVTNTVTAVKNAQLAQSPVVVLGGAAATLLKGRGALQDIDQMALIRPHVKWAAAARAVAELSPLLEQAFREARSGVPGPVFLECPIDLLYDEALVRQMYAMPAGSGGLAGWALGLYLRRHLRRLFRLGPARYEPPRFAPPAPGGPGAPGSAERSGGHGAPAAPPGPPAAAAPGPGGAELRRAAALLARSERPVLVVGSQALLETGAAGELAGAIAALGVPVYLAGGARGLLGPDHPLQLRHRRKETLREADLVLLAGIPNDFRLDYGRHVGRRARLLMVNRAAAALHQNRRPQLAVHADPGRFLRALAALAARAAMGSIARAAVGSTARAAVGSTAHGGSARGASAEEASAAPQGRWAGWIAVLRARDDAREQEIAEQAAAPVSGGLVNPLALCRAVDALLAPDSVIVADGGDFVGTAAYILRPRAPLSWLDPGVFGTLGVGGGFAIGAKLCRPGADVWILYGDGSSAYSLAEFDTLARHGLPVIAVVGNDAGWSQIAREQVDMLHDDVGTVLARTDYHRVAEGYGGRGLSVARPEDVEPVLAEALRLSRAGSPVLVNALIGKTEFRKGSISI
jgi:thiamine pyrophosphate-dependent acetolactate synthase large subunit-like protein